MSRIQHLSLLCILLPLCMWIGSQRTQAQLVNIESKRMHTDSIRFVLTSDILFSYTDNNGEYVLQTNGNASVQYKSKQLKDVYFLVGNVNVVRTQDEDFQNSWFAHFRYNRKLSKQWWAEGFAQSQNNQQLIITQRNLIGAGLRFQFLTKDHTQAYFGNSYMYETEFIKSLDQRFYNHRNSSYLSVNQTFKNVNLNLIGTVYFQPLYRNFSNHRILAQLKAELPLTKILSFSAQYNHSTIKFDSVLGDDRSTNISFGFTLRI